MRDEGKERHWQRPTIPRNVIQIHVPDLVTILKTVSEAAEVTYDWGGTDDGACVSMHALGGSGGMLPQKFFKIRCSEIASEAYHKFIFGLDAIRTPPPKFCRL